MAIRRCSSSADGEKCLGPVFRVNTASNSILEFIVVGIYMQELWRDDCVKILIILIRNQSVSRQYSAVRWSVFTEFTGSTSKIVE